MHRTTTCPSPASDLPGFLAWHRTVFGDLRMEDGDGDKGGGSGGGGNDKGDAGDDGKGGSGSGDGGTDKGFPENTPLAEMTGDQREAYWKHQARKHEAVAKSRADYDEVKKQAAEAEKLRKERETDTEKQIREAGEKAAAEERARNAPRLVRAEFKAAAGGRIDSERLGELLEDLDLSKFLTDKGEVDEAKVAKRVEAWAPKSDGEKKKKVPDLGQGRRQGGTSEKGAAGAAEAARRFGSKDKSNT